MSRVSKKLASNWNPSERTTTRGSRFSRTGKLLAAALCVVIGAELTVRAVHDRLGDAPLYHSFEADQKVHAMTGLTDEGVDIVFVGASVVAAGIDPEVVEATTGLRGYNAALGHSKPDLTSSWTSNVVLTRLSPDIVVIGVLSYDFLNQDTVEQLDQFEDSHGGRRDRGAESTMNRVDRWLYQHSDLWRWRTALRDPETWIDAVTDDIPLDVWASHNTPSGYNDYYRGKRVADTEWLGPRMAAWADRTDVSASVVELIRAVKDSGARPVLVNIPMTQAHIDDHPNGEDDYAAYESFIRSLADSQGVSLLFYGPADPDLFGDIVHMNELGADRFSRQLAHDLAKLGPPPDPETVPVEGGPLVFGQPLPATSPLVIAAP